MLHRAVLRDRQLSWRPVQTPGMKRAPSEGSKPQKRRKKHRPQPNTLEGSQLEQQLELLQQQHQLGVLTEATFIELAAQLKAKHHTKPDIEERPAAAAKAKHHTEPNTEEPPPANGGADPRPTYPFEADETDHCESPKQAYADVAPLLGQLCKLLGKSPGTLKIWDPFFCDGAVKRHLGQLGFSCVYNKCEDFYARVDAHDYPEHDVIITNPPYSGDHLERLTRFCSTHHTTPFLLLLPHFVYTKPYFLTTLGSMQLFYMVPMASRYYYKPPSWVAASGSSAVSKGKQETAPFPSFWYCYVPPKLRQKLLDWWDGRLRKRQSGAESELNQPIQRRFALTQPVFMAKSSSELPHEVRGEFDHSKKRPNARARKRLASKKNLIRQGSNYVP